MKQFSLIGTFTATFAELMGKIMEETKQSFSNVAKDASIAALSPKNIIRDMVQQPMGNRIYMLLLAVMQLATFVFAYTTADGFAISDGMANPLNIIALIAGIAGVMKVILVARGKMTTYFWGLINTVAYIIVSSQSALWGEVMLNAFIFVMQFVGAIQWMRPNESDDADAPSGTVKARQLSLRGWIILGVIIIAGWQIYAFALGLTNDPHPSVDSLAVVLQVIAQFLMTMRYGASQWALWIIANIVELLLWSPWLNYNPIMLALWGAFLINAVYGYWMWTRTLQEPEPAATK
ncbi:nicotinamide mononucleotide transporter [Periweissella cryptocerci]|uniref:Nicotinamide mononucleotide transporter n=1 Tax=Periweissella cryptocerci TaxID=2506420 RepID=A0A4P6YUK2_9LACO|nr:nicotinamide riboside transporter PnuC [Periweissella cryptocerci]QBO36422.1 nicotinamide mononucleotide transporter [Periweissella cryptocerci]